MSAIRDGGLLNVEFLAVLPNDTDYLSAAYLPIQKQLIEVFNNEKLTPMKKGGHAAASGIYRGESQLSSLIQDEDLARLLGKDKSSPLWVAEPQISQKRDARGRFIQDINAQRQNEKIADFLSMLDITEWTTEDLIETLKPQSDIVMGWLQEKSDAWHQDFYALLGDSTSPSGGWHLRIVLKQLHIVQCSDGIYRTGRECHFLSDDAEPDVDLFSATIGVEEETQRQIQDEDGHEENFHYVAKGVYSSGQNEEQQGKAYAFLETIGVREVDETERIKMILKQRYMSESFKPPRGGLGKIH